MRVSAFVCVMLWVRKLVHVHEYMCICMSVYVHLRECSASAFEWDLSYDFL